jgi:thiamine biosynthesis lipoprotein
MNRRHFLHPGHLAAAAREVLDLQSQVIEEAAEEPALLRFSRRAMATDFEVLLPFGTPDANSAAEAALDEIDRLEDQLTVYCQESEVSRLNQRAASEPVTVEENLFDLLCRCARLTQETDGAFDISTGALIKAWGFYRRAGRVPSANERSMVSKRVGMNKVVLDPERRTVRFSQPGVEINFGSIGKGYALDRAADILRKRGIRSALLHGGHSSVYAVGDFGAPTVFRAPTHFRAPTVREGGSGRGWPIGIRHAWKPERLAVVRLRDGALGTSAATYQHLEYEGRKLGHILDPRTAWPAETLASASVLAPTAAEADALATAFFILGVDKARLYCENHPQVGAVLLPIGESAAPLILGSATDCVQLVPADFEETSEVSKTSEVCD